LLTIFCCPKPFTDPHVNLIQRNAIKSWTRLEPRPQILLLGDEAGTDELGRELGLEHVPQIQCNEHGTPLVSDILRQGQKRATMASSAT
jgi:hypothetical protein